MPSLPFRYPKIDSQIIQLEICVFLPLNYKEVNEACLLHMQELFKLLGVLFTLNSQWTPLQADPCTGRLQEGPF